MGIEPTSEVWENCCLRFGTSQPPESLGFSGLFLLHSFRLEAGGHYEHTRHFHFGGHAGTQF